MSSVASKPNIKSRLTAFQEIQGSWMEGFLAEKRAGGRKGVVPKESSILEYAFHLNWMLKNGLDVKTATLSEIKDWLADYQANHKIATYANKVGIIKDALVYLKREDVNEEIRTPRLPERDEQVSKWILPDQEIEKLIREAPTLRDRLMVELFFELGARRGELANVKIKDIQFEEVGGRITAIFMLTGKTGTGPRRIFECIPDLREYLNNHPNKDDPNAPLFFTLEGNKPLRYGSIYSRIRMLGFTILKHPIKPHAFRHTRASKDARYFTDREMMKLNRWKRPDMVAVYAHLSMRDISDKDLVLHGLKTKEDILRPIVETRKCKACHQENAPIAMYCSKCGAVLGKESTREAVQEEVRRILREEYPQLVKELAKD
jgi:integrase/recombinase XerD